MIAITIAQHLFFSRYCRNSVLAAYPYIGGLSLWILYDLVTSGQEQRVHNSTATRCLSMFNR